MAADMWRPPANRLMKVLDRSFFQRDVPLKAVRIFRAADISKCRSALSKSKDILDQERIKAIQAVPDLELAKAGHKCILLRPELSPRDGSPWPHSPNVTELVEQEVGSIIPFSLHLDYSYWTYLDIITAILPEDEHDEIPSGFNIAGHVAHLNLRSNYLKYKHLIAEILLDKNPTCRTVINKINDVGEESEFRTFSYEVLAGPDDMDVVVYEANCRFAFDYSKVYWNSKLQTEHLRLVVDYFKPGEAVCDLMAGVGPFAIPAGKRNVFVWANDLNPYSYEFLQQNIEGNNVSKFVSAFNDDGRDFVRKSVRDLAITDHVVEVTTKGRRSAIPQGQQKVEKIHQPKTFQHFVLNLPASALTFLPQFVGIYRPEIRQTLPEEIEMPLVHVYCFNTKTAGSIEEGKKICQEISGHLNHEMMPGPIEEGKVMVTEVRDVAPKKRMFCASFRLPKEVAYRDVVD